MLIQTDTADYIASKPTMLMWLVQRGVHNKIYQPVYFETDSIYTYDVDNLTKGYTTEEMPKSFACSEYGYYQGAGQKAEKDGKVPTNSWEDLGEWSR